MLEDSSIISYTTRIGFWVGRTDRVGPLLFFEVDYSDFKGVAQTKPSVRTHIFALTISLSWRGDSVVAVVEPPAHSFSLYMYPCFILFFRLEEGTAQLRQKN